ncbi:hypothetical protein NLU13_5383 [Sarocladium strictum]|uniref:phosphoribosylamine--glycine ligase n=1 Tax=Sarocladium strictum TaxID=5046 RepID=A0AA39GGS9_SARSR|nr:hypothetical protein NLU13_5383 [Sarocladium strictum]
MMRILLIGKGAREHALAWKLRQTARHVFVVPGNGGTAAMATNVSNIDGVDMHDFKELIQVAHSLSIDLVLTGPDDIVVAGIADAFKQAGIPCFAPSKAASQLEGSKVFAKDFMTRHNIPTAKYRSFSRYEDAREYISAANYRVVIKSSGLAAGKGVVLPESKEDSYKELYEVMVGKKFGSANAHVVIEEFLLGDEISILTFSDGRTFKSLPPCQDHKQIFDGSKGPNTGGMGVYGPTDFVSSSIMDEIERKIIGPTFEGLRSDGHVFQGMLFTGVMITRDGPKVLEYNVRFGDPETLSLVPLLREETDLAKLCLSCTNGTLENETLGIQKGYACNVVVASAGYPGEHKQGDKIEIASCPQRKSIHIFHAGTILESGGLWTAGGRVFAVCAVRETLAEAVAAAYSGVACIRFQGQQYRTDIGSRYAVPSRTYSYDFSQVNS